MIRAALDVVLRRWGPKEFPVLVNEERLLLPRELRGLVGVDRAHRRGIYFERPAMLAMRAVLRPGAVVLDAGCSYGLITCLIARIIGPDGFIHALDANADVLQWADRVAAMNGFGRQVRFVHCCVGESSSGSAEFFAVPGSKSVASTRNPDIRHFHKSAIATGVPLLALDDYCRQLPQPPSCLKIDVEGSECLVLRGARWLLESVRPDWIIETHGLEIDGIGGSVRELVETLAACGYTLTDLMRQEPVEAMEYAERYGREIGYLLAQGRGKGKSSGPGKIETSR